MPPSPRSVIRGQLQASSGAGPWPTAKVWSQPVMGVATPPRSAPEGRLWNFELGTQSTPPLILYLLRQNRRSASTLCKGSDPPTPKCSRSLSRFRRSHESHRRPPNSLPAAGRVIAGRRARYRPLGGSSPAARTISHIEQAHCRPSKRSLPAAECQSSTVGPRKSGLGPTSAQPWVQPSFSKMPIFIGQVQRGQRTQRFGHQSRVRVRTRARMRTHAHIDTSLRLDTLDTLDPSYISSTFLGPTFREGSNLGWTL